MQKIFQSGSRQDFKGSALVFSLLVLSMILVAALGVASVSVIEQKNSSATGKSTQAFQVADSAVETVLKKAVTDPSKDLTELAMVTFGNGSTCSGGVISANVSGGSADITIRDIEGNPLACSDNLNSAADVKAVGKYANTTRAISAAVAAGTLSWQPVSGTVSFSNSWQDWGSPYGPARCAKDTRTGIVYLKGVVRHLSSGTTDSPGGTGTDIFTLPAGCTFPSVTKSFTAPCSSGVVGAVTTSCRIDINSSGVVKLMTAGFWFSLDNITYSTN